MNLDLEILYLFNRTISSPTLDPLMIALTTFRTWVPIYIIATGLLLYYKRWVGLRLIISMAVLAGLLDLSTNRIIKPAIARERPCNAQPSIQWLRLPDGGRGGFSFPSSHAVNNFGAAVFFVVVFPKRKWLYLLLIMAAIISITRPYLGLHYPSDTLVGAIIGVLGGYGWARLYQSFERRFFETSAQERTL